MTSILQCGDTICTHTNTSTKYLLKYQRQYLLQPPDSVTSVDTGFVLIHIHRFLINTILIGIHYPIYLAI